MHSDRFHECDEFAAAGEGEKGMGARWTELILVGVCVTTCRRLSCRTSANQERSIYNHESDTFFFSPQL
jgi:hypothetical protein